MLQKTLVTIVEESVQTENRFYKVQETSLVEKSCCLFHRLRTKIPWPFSSPSSSARSSSSSPGPFVHVDGVDQSELWRERDQSLVVSSRDARQLVAAKIRSLRQHPNQTIPFVRRSNGVISECVIVSPAQNWMCQHYTRLMHVVNYSSLSISVLFVSPESHDCTRVFHNMAAKTIEIVD